MEVKAKLRHLHIAPRKVRLVIDQIRGLDTKEALRNLNFIPKRAAKPVTKLLRSAIANAEHNFDLDKDNLYIKEIRADEGPKFRRFQPRAFGRAYPIIKRTTHVLIILDERVKGKRKKKAKKTREAPFIKKQTISKPLLTTSKKKEGPKSKRKKIWDPRRLGARRHKEHADKRRLAKQKRVSRLKRFFRRKSV